MLLLQMLLSLSLHLPRKYTMLLNNIVVIVAVCLQSLAVHPVMFIVGRFIVGINSGQLNFLTFQF